VQFASDPNTIPETQPLELIPTGWYIVATEQLESSSASPKLSIFFG
jgi:hypothetical protein